jgi:putative sigma-54 modulation protein
MNVEYTGRQYDITPAIKKEVETGLSKIHKILGDKFEAKAILAIEKHRHKAEITVSPRKNGPLVGLAVANDMMVAVGEAIEHLEKQAVKYKERWRSKKRQARKGWEAAHEAEEFTPAVGSDARTAVPVVVHKFPVTKATTEVHIVSSGDSVALRPMTVEEAVKEAHFRDRDVFVFRDKKGRVKVLHRTRDGKMELIEAP